MYSQQVLACGLLALALNAQTVLTSGVPVPVSFQPTGSAVLLNGSSGYSIAVPANTMRVLITLETATPANNIGLYARCGTDVSTGSQGIVADAFTQPAGTQIFSISGPLAGQPGTCYIAPYLAPSASTTYGAIRADVQAFPPGTLVTVPAIAALPLAGQPDGTSYGGLTAPSSSPPQVNLSLTPGQALHITAAGQIIYSGNAPSTPEGLGAGSIDYGVGIAPMNAQTAGLIAVFLGPSIVPNNPPPALDFNGGLTESTIISPLLQQPFYIGSGYNANNVLKSFIVPTGATRLYLGTTAPFSN